MQKVKARAREKVKASQPLEARLRSRGAFVVEAAPPRPQMAPAFASTTHLGRASWVTRAPEASMSVPFVMAITAWSTIPRVDLASAPKKSTVPIRHAVSHRKHVMLSLAHFHRSIALGSQCLLACSTLPAEPESCREESCFRLN